MFLALAVLLNLVISLVTLSILGSGIWLGFYWYKGVLVGTQYLILSLVLLLFSFFGKHIVMLILGLVKPPGDKINRKTFEDTTSLPLDDGSDIRIEHSKITNSKATLILLHGWGLDHLIWQYLSEKLRNKFSLTMFDLAGQGMSGGPKNHDYSLEKYANDLKAVIDLEEQPVILTGHSIGGMIILTFCKKYPEYLGEKVRKLVLVHTTYTDPTKTTIFSRFIHAIKNPILVPLNNITILISPFIKLINWINYRNGMIHVATLFAGFGGSETVEQVDFIAKYQYTSNPAVNSRGLNGMFDYDATETLGKIHIPVLVITGDRDRLTKKEAGEFIQSHIPNSTIVELPKAGHMGLFERSDEFIEIMEQFLDKSTELD